MSSQENQEGSIITAVAEVRNQVEETIIRTFKFKI